MVLFIIGCAGAFGWLMAYMQVPTMMVDLLQTLTDNPILILLLINIILLILGTFMDMAPLIIICTPIFLPVAKAFDVDPVQFGVILLLFLLFAPAGIVGQIERLVARYRHRAASAGTGTSPTVNTHRPTGSQ